MANDEPIRRHFCKLLGLPDFYSWEAIYNEVKLLKNPKRGQATNVSAKVDEFLRNQQPRPTRPGQTETYEKF